MSRRSPRRAPETDPEAGVVRVDDVVLGREADAGETGSSGSYGNEFGSPNGRRRERDADWRTWCPPKDRPGYGDEAITIEQWREAQS